MSGGPRLTERFLGRLSGRILVRLAVLATRRGDHHEAAHCAAALAVGNTGTHHEPCVLSTHSGTRAVLELAQRMKATTPTREEPDHG